jgi:hypothetical protein
MSFTLVKSCQETVEAKLSKKYFFICKVVTIYEVQFLKRARQGSVSEIFENN